MNFSHLKRASDHNVRKWIEEELDLTPYQKNKLYDSDAIRLSPFYFYERRRKEKIPVLWRLTIFIFPVYWIIAFLFLPIKWLFTGTWGYGRGFIDKFHSVWVKKLGI